MYRQTTKQGDSKNYTIKIPTRGAQTSAAYHNVDRKKLHRTDSMSRVKTIGVRHTKGKKEVKCFLKKACVKNKNEEDKLKLRREIRIIRLDRTKKYKPKAYYKERQTKNCLLYTSPSPRDS